MRARAWVSPRHRRLFQIALTAFVTLTLVAFAAAEPPDRPETPPDGAAAIL